MAQAISLSTFHTPRIPYMQSDSTDPALQFWARQVTIAVNNLIPESKFSFPTPNSNVTAVPGTKGYNIASGASVFWIKQVGSGNTGWVSIA